MTLVFTQALYSSLGFNDCLRVCSSLLEGLATATMVIFLLSASCRLVKGHSGYLCIDHCDVTRRYFSIIYDLVRLMSYPQNLSCRPALQLRCNGSINPGVINPSFGVRVVYVCIRRDHVLKVSETSHVTRLSFEV